MHSFAVDLVHNFTFKLSRPLKVRRNTAKSTNYNIQYDYDISEDIISHMISIFHRIITSHMM